MTSSLKPNNQVPLRYLGKEYLSTCKYLIWNDSHDQYYTRNAAIEIRYDKFRKISHSTFVPLLLKLVGPAGPPQGDIAYSI